MSDWVTGSTDRFGHALFSRLVPLEVKIKLMHKRGYFGAYRTLSLCLRPAYVQMHCAASCCYLWRCLEVALSFIVCLNMQ
jgi:hypothetical protein